MQMFIYGNLNGNWYRSTRVSKQFEIKIRQNIFKLSTEQSIFSKAAYIIHSAVLEKIEKSPEINWPSTLTNGAINLEIHQIYLRCLSSVAGL